jgi:hypothetical protein
MIAKPARLFFPAALLLAGCSATAQTTTCITQADDSKICSITSPAIGLTTRTVERGDKLFVSTCQMSQCSPFEEIPAGQRKMDPKDAKKASSHEP